MAHVFTFKTKTLSFDEDEIDPAAREHIQRVFAERARDKQVDGLTLVFEAENGTKRTLTGPAAALLAEGMALGARPPVDVTEWESVLQFLRDEEL